MLQIIFHTALSQFCNHEAWNTYLLSLIVFFLCRNGTKLRFSKWKSAIGNQENWILLLEAFDSQPWIVAPCIEFEDGRLLVKTFCFTSTKHLCYIWLVCDPSMRATTITCWLWNLFNGTDRASLLLVIPADIKSEFPEWDLLHKSNFVFERAEWNKDRKRGFRVWDLICNNSELRQWQKLSWTISKSLHFTLTPW